MMSVMSGEPPTVSFAELRKSFDVALTHIEAITGTNSIAVERDYFWSIPPDELYDAYNLPSDPTIGQVSESWQHLRDVVAEPDRVLGYHLVWLADVLRAIGSAVTEDVGPPGSGGPTNR